MSQGPVSHEESISEDMTRNHTTLRALTQIYFPPPDMKELPRYQVNNSQ